MYFLSIPTFLINKGEVMKERYHINLVGSSAATKGGKSDKGVKGGKKSPPAKKKGRQLAKKLANRFSTSVGNPWHGQVKPDTRRRLNTDKKKGKK